MGKRKSHVSIYHGYGHTKNLVIYGHVLKSMPVHLVHHFSSPFLNTLQLFKMFFVKPEPREKVRLYWFGQVLETTTEDDGLFKFEWESEIQVPAGWHGVRVEHINEENEMVSGNTGHVYVPHITQYAFVSDIDDTVMKSYSATILKRLRELFTRNARTRMIFPSLAKHYELLAASNTTPGTPNPFFYVSSSEWNLYHYLLEVFRHNKLPDGTFLLSQIKRWFQLFKTGKTKHEAKLLRIMRILQAFPNQQFVLLGDNSQSDPVIYSEIATKYPDKIFAVYLRNIKKQQEEKTREILAVLEQKGIKSLLYDHSQEAIEHSVKIGLIDEVLVSSHG